ncbi:MAG: radical SAM protein [Candidatus Eisenbacteria sp.]|nr:radical SAM protein [Candidatus Eisenbacteria bacterium]
MNLKRIREKALRAARLMGTRSMKPRIGPERVFLQITHACNLACEFCESHGKYMKAPVTQILTYYQDRKTMDRETALAVVRDLAEMKVEHVTLSGRGEPAIHPAVLEIIDAIQRSGMKAQLVTNGVVPDREFARELVRMGCSSVSCSVNAATPDTYGVVCGKDNLANGFETVTTFVRDLVEERRARKAAVPVVEVDHVIYRHNYRDLPAMIDQACEVGIDSLDVRIMGTVDETEFLKLDPEHREWILGVSEDFVSRLSRCRIRSEVLDFLRTIRDEERSIETEDNLQRRVPCYAGWMEAAIGPDGAVRPCCYCDEPLGNIHVEAGFRNVWHNEAYRKMRAAALRIHETGRPICKECFTTCNMGPTHLRIYRRLHPFRKIRVGKQE